MSNSIIPFLSSSTQWPNAPRQPLPPFPSITSSQPDPPQASCWASSPYESDISKHVGIPNKPDRQFHRGNFSGVRVPGLVEGGNNKDPSLMITWESVKYSPSQQDLAVDWYTRGCGYTHVVLSIPQTVNLGKNLDDLITIAQKWKSAGCYIIMIAVSDNNDFDTCLSWMDLLVARGLVDIICSCWQVDKYYSPEGIVQLIIDCGNYALPRGLLTTIHWGGGYPGWAESCAAWDDVTESKWGINNRFTFQQFVQDYLKGHYGQCGVSAPVDAVQSWIYKILVAYPGPQMFFVCAEDDAQDEYDDPQQFLELYGDQKGYLAMCTVPNYGIEISCLNGERDKNGVVV